MQSTEGGLASWRLVDIVTAAVIGVAFGAVFQVWNVVWESTSWAFPPSRGAIAGVWLIPAVVAPMIVRKPGAAIFAETLAAFAEMVFGSPWGLSTIVYGLAQGAAAELVFAFTLYRAWSLPFVLFAGGASGIAGGLLDLGFYYADWTVGWQALYLVIVIISGAMIAGVGSWLLVRWIAQTGVLSAFPAGRSQRPI